MSADAPTAVRPAPARPIGLWIAPPSAPRLALALSLCLASVLVSSATIAPAGAAPPAGGAPAAPAQSVEDSTARAGTPAPKMLARRVVAYYFHTSYRCDSCRKIEAYSHSAVQDSFPEDLASGRLLWRMVNIEEKGNEHFVKDYQLVTKSVVLVEEIEGRPGRWKNLPKIWTLLADEKGFRNYVREEVRSFLAARP